MSTFGSSFVAISVLEAVRVQSGVHRTLSPVCPLQHRSIAAGPEMPDVSFGVPMSRPMLIAACPRCVLGVCVLRLLLISQERLRGTGTRSLRWADPFRGVCLVVETSIALSAYSVCHVAMLFSITCMLMLAVFWRSYIDARECDVCVRGVRSVLLVEGLLECDTC